MAYTGGPLELRYEMAPGADPDGDQDLWNWVEVLDPSDPTRSLVYSPKTGPEVVITLGRPSASGTSDPTSIRLTVLNLNGEWTHPEGAYYAALVQGLPFRVTQTLDSTDYHRGTAFLVSAKPRWDSTLNHSVIDIVCRGALWRVNQDGQALRSAAYRTLINADGVKPIAYWPFEDGAAAVEFSSAVPGVRAATYSGVIELAGDSSFAGSANVARLTETSSMVTVVPTYATSNEWTTVFGYMIPAEPTADTLLLYVYTVTGVRWAITLVPGTSSLRLSAVDAAGASLLSVSTLALDEARFYGHPCAFSLSSTKNGTSIDYVFWAMVDQAPGWGTSGTLASAPHGNVAGHQIVADVGLDGAGFGHLALYADPTTVGDPFDGIHVALIRAHAGEYPYARFERLCIEEGLGRTSEVDFGVSTMGPQDIATLATLLAECETVAGVVMHDAGVDGTHTGLLAFPTQGDRINRAVDLTLTMLPGSGSVSPGIEPSLDDQYLVNDVTVSRPGGGSVPVKDDASIALRGSRKRGYQANTFDDSGLLHIGGLQLSLGAQTGFRFPSVSWNLRNPNTRALAEDWLACIIGAKVVVTVPPSQYPPDDVVTILEGYTEELGTYHWVVRANLSPDIWTVGILGNLVTTTTSSIGRMDATVVLAGNPTTTATSIQITTTSSLVTTDANEFPFGVVVSGEVWTVTNCTGASNPQTLTVTRSVNGIVKAHVAGTPVNLVKPLIMTM